MVGGWIKMRGSLFVSPKVIAIAKVLAKNNYFLDWLAPGADDGWFASDESLRCIACTLLMRVWSCAREHGHFDGNDLIFPRVSVRDLDSMGGAPGIGEAMVSVGWAVAIDGGGVKLPNFKEYNVPADDKYRSDAANRMRRHRGKDDSLRNCYATVTHREEKSREEEKNTPLPPSGECGGEHGPSEPQPKKRARTKREPQTPLPGFDEFWEAYPRKDDKQDAVRAWNKLQPGPLLLAEILAAITRQRQTDTWTRENGRFIPMPSTFLNKKRWCDQGVDLKPKAGPDTDEIRRQVLASREEDRLQEQRKTLPPANWEELKRGTASDAAEQP